MITIDPIARVMDVRDDATDDVKSGKKESIEMAGYVAIFPKDVDKGEIIYEMFHVTELEAPPHEEEGFTIESWLIKTLKRFEEDVTRGTPDCSSVVCMYACILSGRFKNTAGAHPMAPKDPMFDELVAHIAGTAGGKAMAASFGQRVN